jgi:sugar phosphate isomerase/epimerase
MDVAVNTGSLSHDTFEALDRAAELGFRAVEINLQRREFGYGFERKVDFGLYQRLAERVQARNLQVTSLHGLALDGAQVFSSRVRAELLRATARIAVALGAPLVVMHPADLFTSEEALERFFAGGPAISPPVVDGYDECWAQLANRRIALGIENVAYWRGAPGTNQLERLARLLDDLAVHAVFDVRRALPAGDLAVAVLRRWVETLGPRTLLLHVHDASPAGEHQPPLAADWAAFAPLLRQTAAKACVIESPPADGTREYIEKLFGGAGESAEC